MGCLLVYKNIENHPQYQDYFDETRWNDLIEMFKLENYSIFSMTSESQLNIALKAGLSSLKS